MGMSYQKFIPIVIYFLFHLFVLSKHGIVEGAEVLPFDATSEALKKFMQVENGIKFDLPAIYVFGDSYIDSGNTMIYNKQKPQLPYGLDFNHSTPTGRYTNGRTMIDILAQLVGLPFPSTYLAMSDAEKKSTRTGINFGSGGSGILPTVKSTCKVINLGQQVNNFESTLESLKSQFDNTESFTKYLSKSLFFINTANNDIGFAYDEDYLKKQISIPDEVYAEMLVTELFKQLERLHKHGARKFFINNAIPMGSTPFTYIYLQHGAVDVSRNKLVSVYNTRLEVELKKLQSKLEGFQYTLGDTYKVIMDAIENPTSFGFNYNPSGKPCAREFNPKPTHEICSKRNTRIFFDLSHVSEPMHFLIVKRFINEQSLCSPISPIKLIQA
ncbi:hypothetical protein ACFE04_026397 [Oxalis oulophora]